LVGRLEGTLNGRPMTLIADGSSALLRLPGILGILTLRRCAVQLRGVLARLPGIGVDLRVKAGFLPAFTVIPRASFLARLLVPA
jgi:hypothetical protein